MTINLAKRIAEIKPSATLTISAKANALRAEGKDIINCNGSAVFRHFLYSKNEVYFEIKTLEPREVRVRFLTKGKYELILDDRVRNLFEGNSTKIQVPEGEHTVLVLLIAEK